MKSMLNKEQIKNIKICGKILSSSINQVAQAVRPGIATEKLDRIAEQCIRKQKAEPSFKGYLVAGVGRFPASLCVSVNSEVVHGIPRHDYFLKEGDIVSLDLGARYAGVYTDMAITVAVGEISDEAKRLIDVTKKSLEIGINSAIEGNHIGAIGESIESYVNANGFGVIKDLVGHGIGVKPHMDPKIPNFGKKSDGPKIVEGMALAIEPMVTAGDFNVKTLEDNWTIVTRDNSLSAHFEHTVIIENGLAMVVTQ